MSQCEFGQHVKTATGRTNWILDLVVKKHFSDMFTISGIGNKETVAEVLALPELAQITCDGERRVAFKKYNFARNNQLTGNEASAFLSRALKEDATDLCSRLKRNGIYAFVV